MSIEMSWLIALIVVFALTASIIAYSITLFIGASKADVASPESAVEVESLSREMLAETVADFEARVRHFTSTRARYSATSDPSL